MKELEEKELLNITGGLHPILAGAAIAAAAEIIANWDEFKKGFMSAF